MKLCLILLFLLLQMTETEETCDNFKKKWENLACFLRYLEKLHCKTQTNPKIECPLWTLVENFKLMKLLSYCSRLRTYCEQHTSYWKYTLADRYIQIELR